MPLMSPFDNPPLARGITHFDAEVGAAEFRQLVGHDPA